MDLATLSTDILLFLFLVAVVAGFIDTLAGGGGLLTLPALILSGVPPLVALGTNKLQGSMGTATASWMMLKKQKVRWVDVKGLMFFAFSGSLLGTIAVQFIETDLLSFLVPLVLFVIALYFLISPRMNENESVERLSKKTYKTFVIPVIGWYDGMFGPGTGSFFALAGVSLRGHGLINSTAIAKTLNFATNFSSLLVFLLAGKVAWGVGLLMMFGQFTGAWLGSHILFKIQPRLLKFIVVIMCLGMLSRYLFAMG